MPEQRQRTIDCFWKRFSGGYAPGRVPFRLVKRGGRKQMQLPEGAEPARKPDSTLVKALARAFRWNRMLDSGAFMSISELAGHERIAPS